MTISAPNGVSIIKELLPRVPNAPGVYRFMGEAGEVLYVGKAKELPKRLINYTHLAGLTPRIQRAVMQIRQVEYTTTRTEAEALLLEANFIKSHKPRYNILLRDDKSFPYITISHLEGKSTEGAKAFPGIFKHRGEKKKGNAYFGPFAAAGDVNNAITTLQKTFLLRNCADTVFEGRSRPCLEYQIKRCSAPCVGYISKEEYRDSINQAVRFLEGRHAEVQQQLAEAMANAAEKMEYEKAAIYRNRISALNSVLSKSTVNITEVAEADVLACVIENGIACVEVFFIRNEQTLGNKAYFPAQTEDANEEEVLEAFMAGFYQQNTPPKLILLSHDLYGKSVMEEALASIRGSKVQIVMPLKGEKRTLLELVLINAKTALVRHQQEKQTEKQLLEGVRDAFGLSHTPKRIEVFDNSHLFGKHAVGAMIVMGESGFLRSEYRKFTVDSGNKQTGGDDFYMLQQVLTRRYGRLIKANPERDQNHIEHPWPGLILIDGGAGHLAVAMQVFEQLGIAFEGLAAIAKGPDRNAGKEDYYLPNRPSFTFFKDDKTAFFLQRMRDEAHRFAINAHRNKRANAIRSSEMDEIPNIGAVRKKALLAQFGSVKGIKEASLEELRKTKGISNAIAEQIYRYFRP